MISAQIKPVGAQQRHEMRRFEWGALLAVALLFAALSPAFAASAMAMSPSLGAPAAVMSSAQPRACEAVLLWLNATRPDRTRTAGATPLIVADNELAPMQVHNSVAAPQFAAHFAQQEAVPPLPQCSPALSPPQWVRTRLLEAHQAASLCGIFNNRFHE
jgi:hypothetical protein